MKKIKIYADFKEMIFILDSINLAHPIILHD